ncbi:NTP transferase domain-containing protein [Aquisphaera insulae]|uniref:NTP transferase domain-containing protein n=1 Tax=Aquisphaera insulae TaxID=2712864 RepID=UPI0013ED2881|nr:NTP transferase domain-containing protein [Aquisphaera insulae]
MSTPRLSAIVPAAGESRRMGRPKLLLRLGGRTLLGRVLEALREGGVESIAVVGPPISSPEGPEIAAVASAAGAIAVSPETRPPEMRRSVEIGLERLRVDGERDGILLTPGDSPGLTAEAVRLVRERWAVSPTSIVVGRSGGARSHPTILPWDVADGIARMPEGWGINALIRSHADRVVEEQVSEDVGPDDLDTPEDLARWRERLGEPMISVKVRLFAVGRQRAGRAEIEVRVPASGTVSDLRRAIILQHPALADLASRIPIAVDDDLAADEREVHAGSRVALIPPVSGGSRP